MIIPKTRHVIIEKYPDPEGRFLDIILERQENGQGLRIKIEDSSLNPNLYLF